MAWIDIAQMLINLSDTVPTLMNLVAAAAWVMGIFFGYAAIYHLKAYGYGMTMMTQQTGLKQPVTYLIVAVALIWLPTMLSVVMNSTFGYSNPLAYSQFPRSRGDLSMWFIALLRIVQLVGLIAFIKGWVIIARASGQGRQETFGKGLVHLLGGIAAFNIVGTARMLANTLGVSL